MAIFKSNKIYVCPHCSETVRPNDKVYKHSYNYQSKRKITSVTYHYDCFIAHMYDMAVFIATSQAKKYINQKSA